MNQKLRNIGPKSAAWLRQVGIHDEAQLGAMGAVEAFTRIRRAGFKPSLNLLYSLEGALTGVHWQDIPSERRAELANEAEVATAGLPPTPRQAESRRISPVTYIAGEAEDSPDPRDEEG
jgi:hypothetical protein